MFYIDKETPLTNELLSKFINDFVQNTQAKLQKWENYYNGQHKILQKQYQDKSKPCNKIVTNFSKIIVDTYNGYIAGKPVSYSSNNNIEDIQECINYNDDASENIKWLKNALIYGVGYELQWLDEFSKVRYSQINPLNAFAIYENTLDSELLYFVRWYKANSFNDDNTIYVEVYNKNSIAIYKADGIQSQLQLVEEKEHYFQDVPVSVFYLNDTETNIFNDVISINDAYNEIQSSELDDYQAFVDAFLLLEGLDVGEQDIQQMKEDRVLVLPEGAKASWLTKNTNDTQIQNMLDTTRENIFKIASCPDMSDEKFMAQSGEAIKYKLVMFENSASAIVARFEKAIQRRIELICNILQLKASDAVWRDININFVRNLPDDITSTIQLLNTAKGLVSDKTLLSQVPFIDDVEAELEALNEQKQEMMALYSFDTHKDKEDDVIE